MIHAENLHIIEDHSANVGCHRVMDIFMLSCFFDWIRKPDMEEQHRREQALNLKQSHLDLDNRVFRLISNSYYNKVEEERQATSEKGGQKNAVKESTVCCKTNEGVKNPFHYAGATLLNRCEFSFKQRISNVEVDLNTADRKATQTGLNIHFILVVLFSTDKLIPEKT